MQRTARGLAAALVVVAIVGAPLPALADDATATLYAGTGEAGYSGDGGPAVAATLNQPGGIAVGPDGVVYVADTENWVVRAISTDGVISTVAGQGRSAPETQATPVPVGTAVPAAEVTLSYPTGLGIDPAGSVYIGDGGNARILALSPAGSQAGSPGGEVTLVAGGNGAGFSGDGGPAVEAALRDVSGIDVADDGTLVFGDLRNYRVRQVDANGVIDTIVGSGDVGVVAGGEADSVTLPYAPISTATGPGGDRWVASTLLYSLTGTRMRAVVRDGDTQWAYSDSQSATIPAGAWQGNLYVAATDSAVYLSSDDGLYRLYPDGRVETLLADPSIVGPLTMVDDQAGYLVDRSHNRVYRLELPALSDTDSVGGSEWWRQWWMLATVVAVVVALLLAVVAVRRRRA